MEVISRVVDIPDCIVSSVVTIGTFDGIHLGHQELLRQLVSRARGRESLAIVFSFSTHPSTLVSSARSPLFISSSSEKRKLIEECGVDVLIDVPFTQELAACHPRAFVDRVLLNKLRMREFVAGYDCAFGRNRQGTVEFLRDYGKKRDFDVHALRPLYKAGSICSSTRIRNSILNGDVAEAATLLGRPYSIEGNLSSCGFLMAQVRTDSRLLPNSGLYAVKVRSASKVSAALLVVKSRNGDSALSELELFCLDLDGKNDNQSVGLFFYKKIELEALAGFSGFDHPTGRENRTPEIFPCLNARSSLLK